MHRDAWFWVWQLRSAEHVLVHTCMSVPLHTLFYWPTVPLGRSKLCLHSKDLSLWDNTSSLSDYRRMFEGASTGRQKQQQRIWSAFCKSTKHTGVRFVMVNIKFAFWFSVLLSQYRCVSFTWVQSGPCTKHWVWRWDRSGLQELP